MSANETPDLSLGMISEIAQQRRKEAQPILERELPEWVLEISQTEVAYNINPRMLPLRQVCFPRLLQTLKEEYNIEFVRPDLGPLYKDITANRTDEEIGSLLLKSQNPLQFENGRFSVSKSDFVPIGGIGINDEWISVRVHGISQVAELVVAEVAEWIWSSAGVQKRWDDIKKHIRLITYITGTVVNLGFPFESLMSDKLVGFIKSDMLAGRKYSADMGAHSQRYDFKTSPTVTSVYTLDELHILFHLSDAVTGRAESSRFRFSVLTKDTRGTGIVFVSSELTFDRHIACLQDLIKAVGSAEGNSTA